MRWLAKWWTIYCGRCKQPIQVCQLDVGTCVRCPACSLEIEVRR